MKKHTFWLAFAAVFAPLLILLGMQYVWLARLERVSAIAHRAALTNYLEAVGTEVQYFYRSAAERALNLPAAWFTDGTLEEAAAHWRSKPVDGARRLFVVDFTRQQFGAYLVWDPGRDRLVSPAASDESLAMIVACNPWQLLSYRKGRAESPGLSVDERSAEYRIILNPITDDASRVVGVAGMILDERFFREELLPSVIRKALPGFFPAAERGDVAVTVRDARGGDVLAFGEGAARGSVVTARLPFVFSDWMISLHSARTTPERWARANFAFNMSLSGLLAAALMGGLALALRAANRAVRLSQMKSDFVSNVSHELRTPLASIRVFAELLRLGRAATPEKVREYGETIEVESRRLSRLIDNILDFSRIESGRRRYRFVPGDVRAIVVSTLAAFEVHLKHGGFRIIPEIPDGPLPPLDVDADALGQALHNLLDNAVKYSGEARTITVRVAHEDGEVRIVVRDQGIGIAPGEQRKIFERFHRVGTGLVHEVKGSGLGLAIVEHIMKAHRGRVSVASEPGKGSTFTLHLPAPAAGERSRLAETPEAAAGRPAAAGTGAVARPDVAGTD